MTDLSGMVEVVADALEAKVGHAFHGATGRRLAEKLAQAALTALTPHIEKLVEEARGGQRLCARCGGVFVPSSWETILADAELRGFQRGMEEARGGRVTVAEGELEDELREAMMEFAWRDSDTDSDCYALSLDDAVNAAITAWNTRAHSIAPVDDADVVARCRQEAERIVYNRPSSEAVVADVANLLSRLSASGVGHG